MIEKIKAEIERRVDILTHIYAEMVERKDDEMRTYYHGKIVAIEELLSFIESLEKEQPQGLDDGITLECLIDYKSGALIGIDSIPTQEMLKDYCNKIGASRVVIQIRKKQSEN